MYIIPGQNYHNFNVSSMPKSTSHELSVETLFEHFLSAHNGIGICRPRQSRSTTVLLLLEERFIPRKGICYMIQAEHRTHFDPGGRPG